MKSPQPRRADRDEGEIRGDVPEVRDAEQSALVGELVIALILRDRRQQQQSGERRDDQAEEDKEGAILLRVAERAAERHADRIAEAGVRSTLAVAGVRASGRRGGASPAAP